MERRPLKIIAYVLLSIFLVQISIIVLVHFSCGNEYAPALLSRLDVDGIERAVLSEAHGLASCEPPLGVTLWQGGDGRDDCLLERSSSYAKSAPRLGQVNMKVVYQIGPVNPSVIWISGDSRDESTRDSEEPGRLIEKTEDQGVTWTTCYNDTGRVHAVCAVDETTAWIVGSHDSEPIVRKTEDGGGSWQMMQTGKVARQYNDVLAAADGYVTVIGTHGLIQRTTDDGGYWITLASGTPEEYTDIEPAGAETLYICGNLMTKESLESSQDEEAQSLLDQVDRFAQLGPPLLRSTDRGTTWQRLGLPDWMKTTGIRDIAAVNERVLWALLDNRDVALSVDGAVTWREVGGLPYLTTEEVLHDIAALDEKTAIIVGTSCGEQGERGNGATYTTKDGGRSWGATDVLPARDIWTAAYTDRFSE